MVLDKMENGNFIFKNTYSDDKQVEMAVDAEEAPDEFFFINIDYKKTIADLTDSDNSSEDEITDDLTDFNIDSDSEDTKSSFTKRIRAAFKKLSFV